MSYNQIHYSEKYYDNKFEYRHVILPKDLLVRIPKGKMMSERQWRDLGICMSRGWVHYGNHKPEPNVLLFKRKFKGGPTPRQLMEEKAKEFQKLRKKEKKSGNESRK